MNISVTMYFQDDGELGDFESNHDEFVGFVNHYCETIETRLRNEWPGVAVDVDWTEGAGSCNVAVCFTDDQCADDRIGDEIKAGIGDDDYETAWETFLD